MTRIELINTIKRVTEKAESASKRIDAGRKPNARASVNLDYSECAALIFALTKYIQYTETEPDREDLKAKVGNLYRPYFGKTPTEEQLGYNSAIRDVLQILRKGE